jgi:SAM-dependent methyltransferase
MVQHGPDAPDVRSDDPPHHAGWDAYWARDARGSRRLYSTLASIYRRIFICPRLAYWLKSTFPEGSRLLHAGCGGGEVDRYVYDRFRITGLDISPGALARYKESNPRAEGVIHADLLRLEGIPQRFDGVYSLGVLEHFTTDEIRIILTNMRRVLVPDGKMIAFWPLRSAFSVKLLGLWHRALNDRDGRHVELHPPEISLIESQSQVERIVQSAGWTIDTYDVSLSDLYIQAVLVCR